MTTNELHRQELNKKENQRTQRYQEKKKSSKDGETKLIHRGTKRSFPIWLRLLLLICAIVVCFAVGTMVGYGVIGDGEPMRVFDKETWTHIIDLVEKDK
ncbi:DNA-directed RNA polymerase subunit beta [Fictibacillus phosphorivorans]|uniref:DNA-directed RNA polymerase subunit beta n=1 Tax=Fictibacillus phosphorivorans TaxID=1221500 RepID=UPI00203B5FDF|nr:DNA-directed RNA polymerase subunit beta [Fictibacillus phosphorivorans]MCM3718343.1 DNA-directed RNA polymerase subunit beta [Fictibacillus phosphorivorans]MCM3775967.1 DNA-directed RNA polymerase subunit beta [Fictibacillus phosphorivorans]